MYTVMLLAYGTAFLLFRGLNYSLLVITPYEAAQKQKIVYINGKPGSCYLVT